MAFYSPSLAGGGGSLLIQQAHFPLLFFNVTDVEIELAVEIEPAVENEP